MRIIHSAAALAAVTALLAGCGQATGGDSSPDTEPAQGPTGTSSPEWTGDVIPDGTYAKTATMADARKLGLPKDVAADFLGPDGELHVDLKIAGDTFAQFADDEGEVMLQGDGGSATYDAEGNWMTTSNSSGCPGCTATLDWTMQGNQLSLELIETTEAGDPVDLLVGRLIFEGEFTRR